MNVGELEQRATILRQPDAVSPGTVAINGDEAGRYTRFAISIQSLRIPGGSKTIWQIGNSTSPAENRNTACGEMDGDWLFFLDDDHVFAGDILLRLLRRNVDIVGAFYLQRQQPFQPTARINGMPIDLRDYGADELVEVDHTGSSGMLIRRRVIDALESPWFSIGHGVSEDVAFCNKAREAGFKVHVDLAVPLGHITTAVVWPNWQGEGWMTGFDIADGAKLLVEPNRPGDT